MNAETMVGVADGVRVMMAVKEYYKERIWDMNIRDKHVDGKELYRHLTKVFEADGGGKFLYALFPEGPVTVPVKLLGLPMPKNVAEGNFGSFR